MYISTGGKPHDRYGELSLTVTGHALSARRKLCAGKNGVEDIRKFGVVKSIFAVSLRQYLASSVLYLDHRVVVRARRATADHPCPCPYGELARAFRPS